MTTILQSCHPAALRWNETGEDTVSLKNMFQAFRGGLRGTSKAIESDIKHSLSSVRIGLVLHFKRSWQRFSLEEGVCDLLYHFKANELLFWALIIGFNSFILYIFI